MESPRKTPARIAIRETSPSALRNESGDSVVCPVCGYDYVHVQGTRETAEDKEYRTIISFWGECGHKWDMVLLEYKGNTYAYLDNAVEEQPATMRSA